MACIAQVSERKQLTDAAARRDAELTKRDAELKKRDAELKKKDAEVASLRIALASTSKPALWRVS